MKKYTEEDIAENAVRMMEAHKVDKVFGTQDGNLFLEKNSAVNHNASLKVESKDDDLEVFEFATAVEDVVVAPESFPITEIVVTDEDLTKYPALATFGIKAGDTILLSATVVAKAPVVVIDNTEVKKPYAEMSIDELRKELTAREIPFQGQGKEPYLIRLLEADDEAKK